MCGVVGVAATAPIADRTVVRRMRDALCHRGPDDAGEWWAESSRAGLGHRRLAVIDRSPAAHQPMVLAGGQLCVTYNGELYNFIELREQLEKEGCKFRSRSDTEVVLQAFRAWGPACLQRFRGMFAFGVYDDSVRQLFLARDRCGEKPLYYVNQQGCVLFASEIKSFLAIPGFAARLDINAFLLYLELGYVPAELTMLKGVKKLRPGHYASYDLDTDTLRLSRYWSLPRPVPRGHNSIRGLAGDVEALLDESVRRQLIADVPVGLLLSGGIDSGLIAVAAARRAKEPVRTFTVTFPGDPTRDESGPARKVAAAIGSWHTEIVADAVTTDVLPLLARQFDEPIADSSIVPTFLVSKAVRSYTAVALSGDGGDELFGGYPYYSLALRSRPFGGWLAKPIRALILGAGGRLPVGFRGRNWLMRHGTDPATWGTSSHFDRWARKRVLAASHRQLACGSGRSYREQSRDDALPLVSALTKLDFETTLADGYLVKVDRASMLNSLEVRCPWLDGDLVEYAFAMVPDDYKASRARQKIVTRYLAQQLLPSGLCEAPKRGFSIPLGRWLAGDWWSFFVSVATSASPDLFDSSAIQGLIRGQRRGFSNSERLFSIVMFELWRREWRVTL